LEGTHGTRSRSFEEKLNQVVNAAAAAGPTNTLPPPVFNYARRADLMLTRALADYRGGRFPGAEEWIGRSLQTLGSNSSPALEVAARSVLAMTLHQQQRASEAQAALAQATQRADDALPRLDGGDFGATWEQTLTAHLFLGEARDMIRNNLLRAPR
jgi:hypothetical protein